MEGDYDVGGVGDEVTVFVFECYGNHLDLHGLTHSFPTRRSSDLMWRNAGRDEGTRAREHLRRGVEEALLALGQGFPYHPENQALRANLQNGRSEEHTSELQSPMRMSYAGFCLNKTESMNRFKSSCMIVVMLIRFSTTPDRP